MALREIFHSIVVLSLLLSSFKYTHYLNVFVCVCVYSLFLLEHNAYMYTLPNYIFFSLSGKYDLHSSGVIGKVENTVLVKDQGE